LEIIGKYDDSYPNSNLKRVFYTVEIEDGRFVDIMVSEESRVIYAMQNEDGSVIYERNGQKIPGYMYDEKRAIALAIAEYEKDYGTITWKESYNVWMIADMRKLY